MDDNGRFGEERARRRAALHGSAPHRGHTSNRWAGIDRATIARPGRIDTPGSSSSPRERPTRTAVARPRGSAMAPCPRSSLLRRRHGALEIMPQYVVGTVRRVATGSEQPCATPQPAGQVVTGSVRGSLQGHHRGAEPARHQVPGDRVADRATDGESDARRGVTGKPDGGHAPSRGFVASGGEAPEGVAVTNAPDQADNRCRPLRRRDRITARPPREDIRLRKPCRFDRFRTLG